MTEKDSVRKKEVIHDFEPGVIGDAQVAVIGKVNSHWSIGDSPKNLIEARSSNRTPALVHVDVPYRPGLLRLEVGMKIWLILWFDRAHRDIIIQSPHHTDRPKGTFSPEVWCGQTRFQFKP